VLTISPNKNKAKIWQIFSQTTEFATDFISIFSSEQPFGKISPKK